MALKFNPFTGTLDISGSGSIFDPNRILTGPNDALTISVLIDENGNVLVME